MKRNNSLQVVDAPGISAPAMPTFQQHQQRLRPFRSESGYIDWQSYREPLNVIAADDCAKILAELNAAERPAGKPVGARLAKLLLAAYRAAELVDPQGFMRIIAATFAGYPPDIGLAAVDRLTRESRFLPSRAELIEALEAEMGPRRDARTMIGFHVAEHARRAAERLAWLKRWRDWLRSKGAADPRFPAERARELVDHGLATAEEIAAWGY